MFGLFSKKQKPKTALDQLIFTMYGNPPPPAGRANLDAAVTLAFENILSSVSIIDLDKFVSCMQTFTKGVFL